MLALTNGKLVTISSGVIEKGTVLIKEGKIEALGKGIQVPAGAKVIDVSDKVIMPGLIDASTSVGLREDGNGPIGHDESEVNTPVAAHLRAIDAIWPDDLALADAVAAGITTLGAGPGNTGIINGQCAIIKTRGKTVEEMVVIEPSALKISLSGTSFMALLMQMWGGGKVQPRDRSTDIVVFQSVLQKTREELDKMKRKMVEKADKAKAEDKGDAPDGNKGAGEDMKPDRHLQGEIIAKILKGELPVFITAHQNHDIMNALEIADEWGIKIVLEGGSEAHLMVEELVQRDVPVIHGPLVVNRRFDTEKMWAKTPGILQRAGLKVALTSGHPANPVAHLRVQAALAARDGMSEEEALRTITLTPAEILGIADRIGSIEVGKDADLVVLSDDLLRTATKVERVFIGGELAYELEGGDCQC